MRVQRTLVLGTYSIRVRTSPPAISNPKEPPISGSSSPPKTEGLSKRGRQSQSIRVDGATRAMTRPLPIAPWSNRGAAGGPCCSEGDGVMRYLLEGCLPWIGWYHLLG